MILYIFSDKNQSTVQVKIKRLIQQLFLMKVDTRKGSIALYKKNRIISIFMSLFLIDNVFMINMHENQNKINNVKTSNDHQKRIMKRQENESKQKSKYTLSGI